MAPLAILVGCWPSSASAHQGHLDKTPWQVCEARALDDRCEWVNAEHQLARGTCRQVGGELVCVRNQPFEPASELVDLLVRSPSSHLVMDGWTLAAIVGAGALLNGLLSARRSQTTPRSP